MIEFIALSGFLGAGKTTTMMAARRLLQSRGRRVAVMTEDTLATASCLGFSAENTGHSPGPLPLCSWSGTCGRPSDHGTQGAIRT